MASHIYRSDAGMSMASRAQKPCWKACGDRHTSAAKDGPLKYASWPCKDLGNTRSST